MEPKYLIDPTQSFVSQDDAYIVLATISGDRVYLRIDGKEYALEIGGSITLQFPEVTVAQAMRA